MSGQNTTAKEDNESSGSNISEDDEQHSTPRRRSSFTFPSSEDNRSNAGAKVDLLTSSVPNNELREQIEKMYLGTKYYIPPPENLIAKSVINQEPIRSGAPFSFV